MVEVVVSLFSDRDEREIDEYHDQTSSNDSSSESSSSDSSSTNEKYSFGVPGSSIGSCTSA